MRFINRQWIGARFPPRQWQAEALPIALESIQSGDRGIVRAIMGAGKSVLLAEVCRACQPDRGEAIVVTAPTQKLVKQLSATIADRCGVFKVGQYYAARKEFDRPIVVACVDSAISLSEEFEAHGIKCALWIADEAHRTETDTMIEAAELLQPEYALGVTATPWRSDTSETLSLWDHLIYDYGPREALRDGVVVPWRIIFCEDVVFDIDEICLEMIKRAHAQDLGPGVTNAATIDDAEAFARILTNEGVPAEAIHSKISSTEQEAILRRLERGETGCVVHVSLLQEGVDLPWLRWLCMRRPVKSRVRFAQEVGRVLRAHPGKEYATIFDPHALFIPMKLTYDAVLGLDIDEDKPPVELALDELGAAEELEDASEPFGEPRGEGITKRPHIMDAYSAYLLQLIIALEMVGVVEKRAGGGRWRKDDPSQKQRDLIWKMKWVLFTHFIPEIPTRHRNALANIVDKRQFLNKGQCSDLLNILFGLKNSKKWPDMVEQMTMENVA